MQETIMNDELERDLTYQYIDHPLGGQIKIPLYGGKPLGCLKWGHPALIYHFGEHYRSLEVWEDWFKSKKWI